MTAIVIGMEAAGRTRQGTFASAQPCATRDSAQIKFTEHVGQGVFALSAICAGDGACVRAIGILGSLETETVAPQIQWPAPNSQSAHASRAVTAGVLSVISAPLRLFQFFGAFTALRAVFNTGLECAVLQDSSRYLAKSFQVFHSFVVGVAHMQQCNGGNGACPTKEFPISEKEFPRTI